MNRLIKYPKALVFICGVLLLTNIALVAYVVAGRRAGTDRKFRGGPSLEDRIRKEVGFSAAQAKQFHQLMEENRDSLKRIGQSVDQLKRAFYNLLFRGEQNDSIIQSSAKALSDRQRSMDLQLFRHFQQVRGLCDDRQRVKFDSMIVRVTRRSGGFHGRGKGN